MAVAGGGATIGGSGVVIITRTPLRITLGGGGTDLPSYYERFGGLVLSAAINRYIYVAINRTFTDDYFLKYARLERVHEIDDIEHPIIREALRLHPIGPSIELVSVADIPASSGLGSSGTFTVGLLRAIYAYLRQSLTTEQNAAEACHIEMNLLGRPVGKQDQYAAAYGGLQYMTLGTDGKVTVAPLGISDDTLLDLQEHLCMFFTGYSRNADSILEEQRAGSNRGESDVVESLHVIKAIGDSSRDALQAGDTGSFAALMNEHWEHKKRRSSSMSNSAIDRWYQAGMDSGALGGKLVGAGSGGFLLFYTRDADRLRAAMNAHNLSEVRFHFDHDGSVVLVRD
jgi:D-glycero-alpha-D-manno-heptose-7-phosphate kinase